MPAAWICDEGCGDVQQVHVLVPHVLHHTPTGWHYVHVPGCLRG